MRAARHLLFALAQQAAVDRMNDADSDPREQVLQDVGILNAAVNASAAPESPK